MRRPWKVQAFLLTAVIYYLYRRRWGILELAAVFLGSSYLLRGMARTRGVRRRRFF